MAWYYGVNNSELYGSNFSTVLADAPPPLDDTFDEDDNEIVFKNDFNKSKKQIRETETSSEVMMGPNTQVLNEKSKLEVNIMNGGTSQHIGDKGQGSGKLEAEDDFGDFAGFADFGAAFGDGDEQQSWFKNEGSSEKWFRAKNAEGSKDKEPDSDHEYADFAAFQENDSCSNNQGYASNDPRKADSNSVSTNNLVKNTTSNNGCYGPDDGDGDDDDDDDFGNFTSVKDMVSSDVLNASAEESKGTRNMPNNEISSGELSKVVGCENNHVNVQRSQGNASRCNGDLTDMTSVDNLAEQKENENLKESCNSDSKEGCQGVRELASGVDNDLKTQKSASCVSSTDESVELPVKNQECQSTSNMSTAITDDLYMDQSGERSLTDAEKAQAAIIQKRDEENVILSSCNDKEKSVIEGRNKSNSIDCSFDDNQLEEGSVSCIKLEGSVDNEMNNSSRMKPSYCVDTDHVSGEGQHNGDDDEDDFGDFGSFEENCDLEKYQSGSDSISSSFQQSTLVKKNEGNEGDNHLGRFRSQSNEWQGDNFGNFSIADKPSNGDGKFQDFDSFNSNGLDSQNDDNSFAKGPHEDNNIRNFGESNTNDSDDESQQNDNNNDFGDFGSYEKKNTSQDCLKIEDNTDDFGVFDSSDKGCNKLEVNNGYVGAINSNAAQSEPRDNAKESQNNTDDYGEFGSFESKFHNAAKTEGSDDDFGDFGSFESNAQKSREEPPLQGFGDFDAFKAQGTELTENKEDENNDFGDFGAFESKETSVELSVEDVSFPRTQNKENELEGSKSTWKIENKQGPADQTGNNLCDPRATKGLLKDGCKVISSQREEVSVKEQKSGTVSQFQPGHGIAIKVVDDPISACFRSERNAIPVRFQSDVLSSKLDKGLRSNVGLWRHLERTGKEGRILFNWSNSFSQHKKFLSLKICPDRPPPLQAGSMLLPEPTSKFPHFSSGQGFLEPIKAAKHEKQTQNKVLSQDSCHAEVPLPDLSFILDNGLKSTSSKSDAKDNVSDTSSLDLDFFAPSTTQLSDGKSDSRALYEDDLLGLNILSPSAEMQTRDISKPQKATSINTKKVWQHGGVTIPLSQGSKAELSVAAKSVLEQFEDLTFMTSSVLMFPLKSD